jgi:hypothetical protein
MWSCHWASVTQRPPSRSPDESGTRQSKGENSWLFSTWTGNVMLTGRTFTEPTTATWYRLLFRTTCNFIRRIVTTQNHTCVHTYAYTWMCVCMCVCMCVRVYVCVCVCVCVRAMVPRDTDFGFRAPACNFRFHVLTTANMQMTVFCVLAPYFVVKLTDLTETITASIIRATKKQSSPYLPFTFVTYELDSTCFCFWDCYGRLGTIVFKRFSKLKEYKGRLQTEYINCHNAFVAILHTLLSLMLHASTNLWQGHSPDVDSPPSNYRPQKLIEVFMQSVFLLFNVKQNSNVSKNVSKTRNTCLMGTDSAVVECHTRRDKPAELFWQALRKHAPNNKTLRNVCRSEEKCTTRRFRSTHEISRLVSLALINLFRVWETSPATSKQLTILSFPQYKLDPCYIKKAYYQKNAFMGKKIHWKG